MRDGCVVNLNIFPITKEQWDELREGMNEMLYSFHDIHRIDKYWIAYFPEGNADGDGSNDCLTYDSYNSFKDLEELDLLSFIREVKKSSRWKDPVDTSEFPNQGVYCESKDSIALMTLIGEELGMAGIKAESVYVRLSRCDFGYADDKNTYVKTFGCKEVSEEKFIELIKVHPKYKAKPVKEKPAPDQYYCECRDDKETEALFEWLRLRLCDKRANVYCHDKGLIRLDMDKTFNKVSHNWSLYPIGWSTTGQSFMQRTKVSVAALKELARTHVNFDHSIDHREIAKEEKPKSKVEWKVPKDGSWPSFDVQDMYRHFEETVEKNIFGGYCMPSDLYRNNALYQSFQIQWTKDSIKYIGGEAGGGKSMYPEYRNDRYFHIDHPWKLPVKIKKDNNKNDNNNNQGETKMTKNETRKEVKCEIKCAGANKGNTTVEIDNQMKVIYIEIEDKDLGLSVEKEVYIQKRYDISKAAVVIVDGIVTLTVPVAEDVMTKVEVG